MPLPGFDFDSSLPGLSPSSLPGLGRQQSATGRISPAERASFGKELIGKATGGLGYALGTLNKPGRAVRGLLAGRPSELANLIPFSDSMGITDPAKEVTGKKLLEHAGILRPGDKSWGAWGAGLATDIATDPLTYATFGAKHALNGAGMALNKAGALQGWGRKALLQGFHDTESGLVAAGHSAEQIAHMRDVGRRIATPDVEAAARKAGLIPDWHRFETSGPTGKLVTTSPYSAAHAQEVAEQHIARLTGSPVTPGSIVGTHSIEPQYGMLANRPLSGLARMGIPFTDTGFTVGSGKLSQAVAGGMDRLGTAARFGNPVGRHLGALFDWKQGRALGEHTAPAMVNEGSPLRVQLERQARDQHTQVQTAIDQLIRTHGNQYEVPILRAAKPTWKERRRWPCLARRPTPPNSRSIINFCRRQSRSAIGSPTISMLQCWRSASRWPSAGHTRGSVRTVWPSPGVPVGAGQPGHGPNE